MAMRTLGKRCGKRAEIERLGELRMFVRTRTMPVFVRSARTVRTVRAFLIFLLPPFLRQPATWLARGRGESDVTASGACRPTSLMNSAGSLGSLISRLGGFVFSRDERTSFYSFN